MATYGVEMSDEEIGSFLARRGHGVLSFGGEVPYGLPISFGYDVLNDRCVFQLLFPDDSKKGAYLDESAAVTLVAYEWESVDEWRSVIVDGELSPIPDDSPEAVDAAAVFAEFATVVGASVFDQPLEELDSNWYDLSIRASSGRKSPRLK
ncbi:pyridoxamine 5'-phosphate oxidase family protein [Haloplanus litoreus]|uniref:Pyridoxamine 5'-phosphate oxidase family protein n=1 Tax=Haloplanus litoreus TaxID=767515 RepID=A0ABD5ZVA1_9EURY